MTSPPIRCLLSDHPRSRGVYDQGRFAHELFLGSSPLARGLLTPQRNEFLDARIIPARAGFTFARVQILPD